MVIFHGIAGAMASMNMVLIQVSIFASLYLLTMVFHEIHLNFDKPREFECSCGSSRDVTKILRNISAIRGTTNPFEFYLVDIYFIVQGMDKSPSNTTPSVEVYSIIVTIIQIISCLVIQSSTNAVYCHTQIQLTMHLQENAKIYNYRLIIITAIIIV